jgi:plasmid stability protein
MAADITLKKLPAPLRARLAARAKAHKRSLDQEAMACLQEMLTAGRHPTAQELRERFRKARESVNTPPADEEFLHWPRTRGRE